MTDLTLKGKRISPSLIRELGENNERQALTAVKLILDRKICFLKGQLSSIPPLEEVEKRKGATVGLLRVCEDNLEMLNRTKPKKTFGDFIIEVLEEMEVDTDFIKGIVREKHAKYYGHL